MAGPRSLPPMHTSISTDPLTSGTLPNRPPSTRAVDPIVFVVAEDENARQSLERPIASNGFEVESGDSTEVCLTWFRPGVPCCLLLEVSRGVEPLRHVSQRPEMPTILITHRADVRVTVQAMKAGAVDVLTRPVNSEQLLDAVDAAIALSRAALAHSAAMQQVRQCYASLTPREREVMTLVVSGLLNKQVAGELGISEITVKAHRGQVMRKMKANSLPHLVRMAGRLEIAPHQAPGTDCA